MAQKKCLICGQPIDDKTQKAVPYKGRYAHKTCFNNLMKITVQKKQEEIEEKKQIGKTKKPATPIIIQDYKTEEEFQEQNRYYEVLKSVLNVERLPARIYKISEDYVKKYGFTFRGMENSIRYFFLIKQNEVEGDGIGIIPYIYDEAQQYFAETEEINNQNADIIKRGDKLYRTRVIKIKPNYDNTSQLIDINNLWGDEDANR